MPTIHPFKGFRFEPSRAGRLEDLVTQPYDKIPEELRLRYLERSPFNIVRVIRNPDYREAGAWLKRWIKEGILAQDPESGFYLYEQQFDFEGSRLSRIGLMGLVALDDADLVVRGHEKVLERPLADRLNLIRETEANEGLIFTLFSDPALEFDKALLEVATREEPVIDMVDDLGVVNRVWIVRDPARIREIGNCLQGKALYIADGHHRFQTSVLFNRECAAAGRHPLASESYDKRLIAVFNMHSEGMRILPTHRGVFGLKAFDLAALTARLEPYFEIIFVSDSLELLCALEEREHCIGLSARQGGRLVTVAVQLRPGVLNDPGFMPGVQGRLRGLDVTLLHTAILADGLGISPEAVTAGQQVEYFREKEGLLEKVRDGRMQLGCFLKATSLEQVRDVAEEGLRMPQKSTDFYPKLLTGLVIMKMQIGDPNEVV